MRNFLWILIICAIGYGAVLAIDYRLYVEDQTLMLSAHFQVFELLCPIVAPGKLLTAVDFSGANKYVLKFQDLRTGRYELSVGIPKPDARNGVPCYLEGNVSMTIIQNDHVCCRKIKPLESSFSRDGMFVMDGVRIDVPGDIAKGVASEIWVVFDEYAMQELMKCSGAVISIRKGSAE